MVFGGGFYPLEHIPRTPKGRPLDMVGSAYLKDICGSLEGGCWPKQPSLPRARAQHAVLQVELCEQDGVYW